MGEHDFRSAEVCRRLLTRRSRDITQATASKSALVIAPHPDDETLGCGSTIARKTAAGSSVSVCVVSDGGALPTDEMSPAELVATRQEHLAEACAILGVNQNDISLLGFPDSGLAQAGGELVAAISEVIEGVKPDEIFLPTRHDVHPDHQTVNRVALEAVARSAPRVDVFAYPVWFWVRATWLPRNASAAAEIMGRFRFLSAGITLSPLRVDAGPFLDAKRRATKCYAWELGPDRDFFEHWALDSQELFFASRAAGRPQP
jgi:LmbE family N-acetylglucosaminyl deacetylase